MTTTKTKKNLSVEDRLTAWAAQGPYHVNDAQITFVAAMRIARAGGVGYGWMRQIVGWEWEHESPGHGMTDEVAFEIGRRDGRDPYRALLLELEWIPRVESLGRLLKYRWECPSCHVEVVRQSPERPSRDSHMVDCAIAKLLREDETRAGEESSDVKPIEPK